MADPRLAVVTGAANGLGRAIALRLAQDGNRIAAADRDEAGLATLADVVRQAGGEIVTWSGDLTDTGRIVTIFGEIRDNLGPVDILVNNVAAACAVRRCALPTATSARSITCSASTCGRRSGPAAR